MTTFFDPSETLLGLPVATVQSILTSFHNGTRSPEKLGRLSRVKLDTPIVVAILGECLQRGIIEERPNSEWRQFRLSLTGQGLISAKGGNRHSREAVEKMLGSLLSKCASLNDNALTPAFVSKVWVFGSYLDRSCRALGDLDIVIEREFSTLGSTLGFARFADYLVEHYPGTVSYRNDAIKTYRRWFERMLFGKRRHPLIAEVGIGVLKGLHVPCALVFDASQGGLIKPRYFDHHPASEGREDWANDRVLMPDLKTVPVDFEVTPAVVVSRLFTEPLSILPDEIVYASSQLSEARRSLLKNREIDGVTTFLFAYRVAGTEALVSVSRSVSYVGDAWRYALTLEMLDYRKSANGPEKMLKRLMEVVERLVAADVFRLDHHRRVVGPAVPLKFDSRWASSSFMDAPLPAFSNDGFFGKHRY